MGQQATLSVEVTSIKDYEEARVDIEMPSGFEFAAPPNGLKIATLPSSLNGRPVSHAVGSRTLTKGVPMVFLATIRAQSLGAAQIAVRVTSTVPGGVEAGSADVFLTVGPTEADSHFGIDVPSVGSVTPAS